MDTSEPDSNANKENENQSNLKVSDSKEESDSDAQDVQPEQNLINMDEFNKKYNNLQKQWLDGFVKQEDLDSEQVKKYGDHSYILSYILPEHDEKNKQITFHPNYSYSYTNYDKDCILPSMDQETLIKTKTKFESHVDRLEKKILSKIRKQQKKLNEAEEKKDEQEKTQKTGWIVPEYCVPIRADIRAFDFNALAKKQKELSGRLFDVIMMDPPWQLATANPTRGVAIGYSQLEDNIISGLPISILQENGFLFVWVINAKYRLALQLFKKWGYKMIGDVSWVKQTVNRRIANGHGFYLQHAKETCLIGLKGDINQIRYTKGICSDVIYSERRGQSQKPEEIYQYIEQLIPKGYYMEIFARRNNLRNGWFSIGNEL